MLTGPRVAGLMFPGHLPVQGLWTNFGQKTSLLFQTGLQGGLWAQAMRWGRAEGGSIGLFLLLQLQVIWRPEVGSRGPAGGNRAGSVAQAGLELAGAGSGCVL